MTDNNTDPSKPERDPKGRWRRGQSGNASGRAKGTGWTARMREELRKATPSVLMAMYRAAVGGDVKAAALLLERSLAPVRPGDPVVIDATGSLAARAEVVMARMFAGEIAPVEGAEFLAALGQVARIVEIDELEARIRALEARSGDADQPT